MDKKKKYKKEIDIQLQIIDNYLKLKIIIEKVKLIKQKEKKYCMSFYIIHIIYVISLRNITDIK